MCAILYYSVDYIIVECVNVVNKRWRQRHDIHSSIYKTACRMCVKIEIFKAVNSVTAVSLITLVTSPIRRTNIDMMAGSL